VALVGRSNVGKSSLINALVRRPLARTSAAPGKTRLANFYRVQVGRRLAFYLVDLPGYGYVAGGANAASDLQSRAQTYFARGAACGVLLLVDSRHPGLDSDRAAWEWLQLQPIPKAVIATKLDKLTRAERTRHVRELESSFHGPVHLVSAHSGEGLEELWKLIVRLINPTATEE
jgi:GTP-binding protein